MKSTKSLIIEYADKYNIKEFIDSDPIQFPSQYKNKKDIEISAFISSWLAYGNRKAILKTLEDLHKEFINKDYSSPYFYIKERGFEKYKDSSKSLYRFYKYNDFYNLCQVLYYIYIEQENNSLEDKIIKELKNDNSSETNCLEVIDIIIHIFKEVEGIPINNKSACKRLCMLMRWLVRNDNIVDLGIWTILKPQDLIIPVDTHVHQQALKLGLTKSKQANMKTALEITSNLKAIFPLDPTLADFSLFGYGVNNKK
ncbi:MAG: TIGR02757 family protein [Bacteroidales bacterium]|nr:TIGR02757 family protein [Bacteroidales bacterium]